MGDKKKEKKLFSEQREKVLNILHEILLNDETKLIKKFDHAFKKIGVEYHGHLIWVFMEDKILTYHDLSVALKKKEYKKIKNWIDDHEIRMNAVDAMQRLEELESMLGKKNEQPREEAQPSEALDTVAEEPIANSQASFATEKELVETLNVAVVAT